MIRDLLVSRGTFSLLVATFLLIAGCPSSVPPPAANQPPIADAGGEQTVNGGDEVFLDGSGSSDPDGNSLAYEWTQVAGQSVALAGWRTVQASFLAPNQDATLRFMLTVTDEADASSTDAGNVVINSVDNVPPVASAGSNRTVSGGAAVLLYGDGSYDDDGDPLTYSWVQIGGTSVTLADSDTDSPSFTSRNENEELVFELTVDDGNGHTDTDTVTITAEQTLPALFVASLSGNSILKFVAPADEDANVELDATLSDAEAQLDAPIDVLLIGTSSMIVLNHNSDSMNLYRAVAFSLDDQAPYSVVQGPATLLDQPVSMAYDSDAALIFVANTGASNDILVFPAPAGFFVDPSEEEFSGDLPPLREISSAALSLPAGIALDDDNRLYVANTGSNNVLVFNNASEIEGDILPDRTISSALFTDPLDVFVDASDTLYVVDSSGIVLMFSNASTRDGNSTPSSTLSVQNAERIVRMAVDTAGIGYIVDSEASAVYVFDDVSSVSGDRAPDLTISGDESQLNWPIGLFLLE